MSVGRLPLRVRVLGAGMAVVLTMLASYVVLGREHIAALDSFAYADPTVSFTASRSAAPSGSVIHLAGAPTGPAVAEFSGDGVLAYSPAFADATGVATIVPPLFRGTALASGDVELRLLLDRGAYWSSSGKTTFKVENPGSTGTLGIPSLFGLAVTRGLLVHAAESARIAADAGAPSAAQEQSAALNDLGVEIDALILRFEAVVSGNSTGVTRFDMTIDSGGIRLMDQLMTPYFTSLGPASPSPCGEAKDVQARAGLTAQTVAAVKAAATLFVRSLVDCDSQQVREVASRTSAWLSTVAYTTAEAVRTIPELPKVAGLLLITVASWGDEATNVTYLWKQYGDGVHMRSYMLERNAKLVLGSGDDLYITYELALAESGGGSVRKKVRVPEYLAEAAEQDTYLSGQIERLRKQRDVERALLESVFDQDEAVQARVAQSLQARQSTPTTPPPTATPAPTPTPTPTATPTPTPAPATAAPTVAATLAVVPLPPTPSALSYATVVPPPLTAGKAVTFGFCVPRPVSATALCGAGSANPKGGNPPYTFTYSVPRPFGLTFNSNGLVTGTPTSSGPYSFEVCVKDLSGASVCRTVGSTIAAPTPAPTAAPAAFSPSFQSRIRLGCGGDSRLFFTMPAGVTDALSRVSPTASAFSFSHSATRSDTIFQPCTASGTITVHRSTANAWSVILDATITTGGYGSGVWLEITPLGGSTSLAVTCNTTGSGTSITAQAIVSFRNGRCDTGGSYSGTNPAGADTFGTLVVRDQDKGKVTGATGRAQIVFTLTPN